jgi:hypothetical protein
MDLVKQGQTTDIQFGLRMITGNGLIYGAKLIKLTNCTVIISDRFENVTWYNNTVGNDSNHLSLPFANIFQSFVDPERPTEEEFVMFKLQYGVDWIVEPLNLSSEGTTK